MCRPLLVLACALAAAAPLAGCGNKESEIKSSETEGAYLDLGDLRYQVEISRQLNPADVEDRTYLEGVPASVRVLHPGESWFGIFILVQNENDTAKPAANDFELEDTTGVKYRPIPIARTNPFAYVGGNVPANSNLPPASSLAQANESINGSLVLFKVKTASFANRPLELMIFGPTVPQDEVRIAIDV